MAGTEFYDFDSPESAKVKPEFSLLPQDVLRQIAIAFTLNKANHAKDDITRSDSNRTVNAEFNALMRHWVAFISGLDADEETGYHPTVHMAARAIILCHLALREDS